MSGDLAALVQLENAAFATDRMSSRQLRRHLESLTAEVVVAISGRDVAGSAVLFFRHASHVARLYSIAVAPGVRGRGVGQLLLAAGEQAARQRKCSLLRLEVRLDNAVARHLYETQGYSRFGMRPGYYEDGHDALRYEKKLGSSAS